MSLQFAEGAPAGNFGEYEGPNSAHAARNGAARVLVCCDGGGYLPSNCWTLGRYHFDMLRLDSSASS